MIYFKVRNNKNLQLLYLLIIDNFDILDIYLIYLKMLAARKVIINYLFIRMCFDSQLIFINFPN